MPVCFEVVQVKNQTVPTRIVNFTNKNVVLNPNTRLDTLSPIAEINPKTDETVITKSYSEVKINSQILAEDQKQKLRQLIKEYDIIIAKHEFDVGSTHVVEHEILLAVRHKRIR